MTQWGSTVRKAVIPAAGLGTRFLPATKAMPKEMLPVVDAPAIQYVVEEAVNAGLTDVLMITGRSKRALEDHFDRAPDLEQTLEAKGDIARLGAVQYASDLGPIHYVRQGEPKGLGACSVVRPTACRGRAYSRSFWGMTSSMSEMSC